jgi:hypothetical protein
MLSTYQFPSLLLREEIMNQIRILMILLASTFSLQAMAGDPRPTDELRAERPSTETYYSVKCEGSTVFSRYEGKSDTIVWATTDQNGTTILQKDNTIIKYSVSVPCQITKKTIELPPKK